MEEYTIKDRGIAIPLQAWKMMKHVIPSIFIATLFINLLSLAFPLALLQVYDRIIPNRSIDTLIMLIFGVGIALILEAILRVSRTYVSAWADAKFEHTIGCKSFERIINSPLEIFEAEGSGVHLERLSALNSMRDFYIGQAITAVLDIPFVIIFLLIISYIGGWLVLAPIAMLIIFLCAAIYIGEKLQLLLQKGREHDDRRLNFIIEIFSGIHTIKAMAMEALILRRYERLQRTGSVNNVEISLKNSSAAAIGFGISQITLILVVAAGSMLVIEGNLTVGGLAACTLLAMRCTQPINRAIGLWSRLQSLRIAQKRVQETLQLPMESSPELPKMQRVKGHLELVNIALEHHLENKPLFKHLNVEILPRQTIGITGSGLSGKSSLLLLMMGILKPSTGTVFIDGQDISQYQATSVRRQIAYLPQTGTLFQGTILDNLTLFRDAPAIDKAIAVAKEFDLADIIGRLPLGFETPVGHQAVESLPRGIKQRIAIARALADKPPIILFDEANTAIDQAGDQILQNMLKRLVGTCTMILVSHRPSVLNLAHLVYHIDKGVLKLQ